MSNPNYPYGQQPPLGPNWLPPGATPPPPKKKKTKKWPFVVGGIVLLFVIIGVSNGGNSGTSTTTAAPAAPLGNTQPAGGRGQEAAPAAPAAETKSTDTITYEVTGKGVSKANNITYVKDEHFGQQQENSAKLPWKKTVEFPNGFLTYQPMSLVAQSGSGGNGDITCRILKNGEELTSSTSSGPYAVVTCSAN